MLLEAEKQNLETELEVTHKELSVLKMKLQKASSALENSVSRVEHTTTIDKLKWYVKKKKNTYILGSIMYKIQIDIL